MTGRGMRSIQPNESRANKRLHRRAGTEARHYPCRLGARFLSVGSVKQSLPAEGGQAWREQQTRNAGPPLPHVAVVCPTPPTSFSAKAENPGAGWMKEGLPAALHNRNPRLPNGLYLACPAQASWGTGLPSPCAGNDGKGKAEKGIPAVLATPHTNRPST